MSDQQRYIVVCQRALCSPGEPITIHYGWDGDEFETREAAIQHGYLTRGSDDFNIAVIEGERLVSFDWMDKPVGEDDASMAKIAEKMGLQYEPQQGGGFQ